jgi:hypothetical protein
MATKTKKTERKNNAKDVEKPAEVDDGEPSDGMGPQ